MKISLKFYMVLGVLLLLVVPHCVFGKVDDDVAKVLSQWQRRQKEVRSVRCIAKGERFIPKGRYANYADQVAELKGKLVPARNERFEEKESVSIDFSEGKVHKDKSNYEPCGAEWNFCPAKTVTVFDGKRPIVYEPRDANTSDAYTPSPMQPEVTFQTESYAASRFFTPTD